MKLMAYIQQAKWPYFESVITPENMINGLQLMIVRLTYVGMEKGGIDRISCVVSER